MKTKALLLAAVAALLPVGQAFASPAATEGSFSAQLLPFPKLAAWGDPLGITQPGCLAGQEGVNWVAEEFTAPSKGTLVAETSGFTGDFDLYILDDAGTALIRSENNQIIDQAPAEESVTMPLKPKQTVSMAVCNWLGAPDVTVTWTFTAAKKR
ncbi:MAG: PPC domain-containing protein [Actinomycetota bacterium]|nr:PPC domain-containing protein [Actinomycetota bacterium]